MQKRCCTYKWLITLWLVMLGAIGSPALAYQQAKLPASWSTTPTFSSDRQLNYQFRSTSSYTPTMHTTVYQPGLSSPTYSPIGPRRTGSWDDPDDEELGQVNTPVGEPLVLLLFAALFLFRMYRKRRNAVKNV